jgi:uncharacterized membrane protein (DUF106 family)
MKTSNKLIIGLLALIVIFIGITLGIMRSYVIDDPAFGKPKNKGIVFVDKNKKLQEEGKPEKQDASSEEEEELEEKEEKLEEEN